MAAAEIFVYYRVGAAHEAEARRSVAAFQRALRSRFPSVQARLLRRQGDGDVAPTLMETYALPAGAAQLPGLLEVIGEAALVLGPWLLGERHLEVFEACA